MLRPFKPSLAPDLANLYNEAIAAVPDTAPRPEAFFADPMVQPSLYYALRDQELMVAEEGGQIVGFVHVGVAPPATVDWHPQDEPAVIRCLIYRPGHRTAGSELLAWAEQWGQAHGKRELAGWNPLYTYPYQCPRTALSERLGHVRSLLAMAGHRNLGTVAYLNWRDFTPPEPTRPELDFQVEVSEVEGLLSHRTKLEASGPDGHYGLCLFDRGHASLLPDAEDWCYCIGLFIDEKVQGRRLGSYLLALGLREMRQHGCRHSAITVELDNPKAELFYTHVGYRYADLSTTWVKDVQVADERRSCGA